MKKLIFGRFDVKEATKKEYMDSQKYNIDNKAASEDSGVVIDLGGYDVWIPSKVFENLKTIDLKEDNKLSLDAVKGYISEQTESRLGKSAVLHTKLLNGFEIVETAAPISEENYDHDIGIDICKRITIDKIFMFLGFISNK